MTNLQSSTRAIAIDGPAASGKSTLARKLAARLGLVMVNTGEMYRAVTWELLRRGVDPADRSAVLRALPEMELGCGVRDSCSTVKVGGVELGAELRGDAVNARVSEVSAIPEVRERLVRLQRDYLKLGDVVMEGRDIGTVVFPDTPFKIYIDAPVHVRSARREPPLPCAPRPTPPTSTTPRSTPNKPSPPPCVCSPRKAGKSTNPPRHHDEMVVLVRIHPLPERRARSLRDAHRRSGEPRHGWPRPPGRQP